MNKSVYRTSKEVKTWTSAGKTFSVGDFVQFCGPIIHPDIVRGTITSIVVDFTGDGHVILDDNPNTLTDFIFVEFDKSYYRDEKLTQLGI